MYKIFPFLTTSLIFGSVLFFYYKKFNITNIKFFSYIDNSNTIIDNSNTIIDNSNTIVHKSIINAINIKKDKNTQTDIINNSSLNKISQMDNETFLKDMEEYLDKSPEKYKWFFI